MVQRKHTYYAPNYLVVPIPPNGPTPPSTHCLIDTLTLPVIFDNLFSNKVTDLVHHLLVYHSTTLLTHQTLHTRLILCHILAIFDVFGYSAYEGVDVFVLMLEYLCEKLSIYVLVNVWFEVDIVVMPEMFQGIFVFDGSGPWFGDVIECFVVNPQWSICSFLEAFSLVKWSFEIVLTFSFKSSWFG